MNSAAPSMAPMLTKLSARISYSYSTGHRCQVGINSTLASPEDALGDIANELAFIAARAGLGHIVVKAITERVDEIMAALATSETPPDLNPPANSEETGR